MNKYRYVFVVLVYKNIEVLKDFFKFLSIDNSKVIVVNSFFDNDSLEECRKTAIQNNADFIPIENKGFGYGNNIGSKYAMEHYNFTYLILSNSDIHILNFKFIDNLNNFSGIIAPKLQMLTGKMQNPNIPWKMGFLYHFCYYVYKHDWKRCLSLAHIATRISREIFYFYSRLIKKDFYEIYCCHGAFIIFSSDVVPKLYPFFDDKMFLYNEESYLALLCKKRGVKTYYCPNIIIEHLEGASTDMKSDMTYKTNKQSYIALYSHIINDDF